MKSREVDAYIAGFPKPVQVRLRAMRRVIRAAAPDAEEIISYRMPAYRQHGILVYFAGFKEHIGLYPPIRGNPALGKTAKKYAGAKGNLKFPHNEVLPVALVARIVRHNAKQDRDRAALRKKKRSS
jgi:uncharacterized protein YdhG (YjbR/CyaY superfamily)